MEPLDLKIKEFVFEGDIIEAFGALHLGESAVILVEYAPYRSWIGSVWRLKWDIRLFEHRRTMLFSAGDRGKLRACAANNTPMPQVVLQPKVDTLLEWEIVPV